MSVSIEDYGIFDSKKIFSKITTTPQREVKCFELDYILTCDKTACCYIGQKAFALQPRMLIVRKPGDLCFSNLHFTCYTLHVDIPLESELFDLFSALPSCVFALNDIYRDIFEQIFQHFTSPLAHRNDFFVLSKLYELYYHLSQTTETNSTKDATRLHGGNETIRSAVKYIDEHFDQKITLNQLGEVTGYSPNHLHKLFKQIVGVSPQRYLENARVASAKFALCTQEQSLSEIAYSCGFSSQSHFTHTFKRLTGLSPQEYRKTFLISY